MAMNQITIVMYHYVRELQHTGYPKIKALLKSEFAKQLAYLEKYYQFVTVNDCIDAIYFNGELPSNAILLTFDDGYIDHFNTVFPILQERGIQGCFFPPAKAILKHEVLDVNKIHFFLASISDINIILDDIFNSLDKYRSEFSLKSNDHYFSKLAQSDRFDSKEIIFIKRLLQVELEEKLRNLIVGELFQKYVTNDEGTFSQELYMNIDQIKCMVRNGMYIGSHGYDHCWLDNLSPGKQEKEIEFSLNFLNKVGSPTDNWVMCYPYGAYNNSLIDIIVKKNCKFALTTKAGIASLSKDNAFTLERFDTNDFPKVANTKANILTRKVVN